MTQSQVSPGKSRDAASRQAGVPGVTPLINDLTCKDVFKCRRARQALVDMGESVVPYLVDALDHRKGWVRWEAAKALGQIPGAAATAALVAALGDRSFDVRWLAAEGLIFRRRSSVNVLTRVLPRLDRDVFFVNIESRTELVGKLLGILLPLKEH